MHDESNPMNQAGKSDDAGLPGMASPSSSMAPPAPVDALARRRLLLKSLGKGSALAAAATPLASFSAPLLVPTTDGTQCTISGFKSALASRAPVGALPCGGYSPSHFVSLGNPNGWPAFTFPLPSGTASLADLKLNDLFPGAPSTLVLDILNNTPAGVQALFIAAYFNARLTNTQGLAAPAGRVALPYSTLDVVTQYNGGNPSADAIGFYQMVLVNA